MAAYSIRVQLTVWYSAVLLGGLLMFAISLWFALEHRLLQAVDNRLSSQIESLRTVIQVETPLLDEPQLKDELAEFAREVVNGEWIVLRTPNGQQLLPAAGPPLLPETQGQSNAIVNGRNLRLRGGQFINAGRTYKAVVAAPMTEVTEVLDMMRNLLLFLIPAVMIASCLGGYWISGRALAPVDQITEVARTISVQNLSQRLMVSQTGDALQRMSETWNDMLRRLDSAVIRIQRFTADASHELRTPLAIIRATAELALRRERSAAEYRQALTEIKQESERMTELTEALLTIARADAGKSELKLTPVNIGTIAAEVAKNCQSRAEECGVELLLDVASGVRPANANADAIGRLLLILLDNACKHTPRGGLVTVMVQGTGSAVRISVQDNGEGMPGEILHHIFERFYTANPARSGNRGVGLGLAIAQGIAEAHHTQIQVHSQPGAGSTFWLDLRSS